MIEAAVTAAAVPPFHAMVMNRRAADLEAEGARVLHLEVGQPSTPLPRAAREAVEHALDDPLGYTPVTGLQPLREAIAARYRSIAPERVLVCSGASAGFTLAFLALFERGARVGIVEPGYPCYRNALIALGMKPVPIPVGDETRWAPTPELVKAAGPLDGLVLASPSNPTGTVLRAEALDAVTSYCAAAGIRVVADEIYHGLVADPAPQVLDHHDDAFVVNSFSKYFSMTGWRVGWVVVPESIAETVARLHGNFFICAPHVSQVAALAALDATVELEGHAARYRANRVVMLEGLAAAGIDRIAPADGAFYVYAHVPRFTTELGIGSLELCNRWLEELGVCTTPGVDFDQSRGHEYVRFSYAGDADALVEACDRIASWVP